ncbi:MAG: hypothetical protein JWN30_1935, partial [Bacilli bacterium]|nr:hypothetical protein [Bacilli bacterium]
MQWEIEIGLCRYCPVELSGIEEVYNAGGGEDMRSYLDGPRYTLEGYVKRLLYEADGPLSENDIVSRVQDAFGREELDTADLSARVNKALTRLNAPFLQQDAGWVLRTGESNGQLNDRAAEALILASAPQSYGRILEYIGLTTKRSRGDL